MKKIVVVGATGSTGRLTCEKLFELCGSGSEVRIELGGREKRALEILSLDLGKRFKQPVNIHKFDFGDRSSLRPLIEGASVVINCAAPYSVTGNPLLAAATTWKAHLIDACTEPGYVQQCVARASTVKEAGVAVINSLAVDGGATDLAVEIAAKKGFEAHTINVLYIFKDLEETQGMRASWLEAFQQPCQMLNDGRMETVKLHSRVREFSWPGGEAKGRLMPAVDVTLLPRRLPNVRNVAVYRVLEGKVKSIASWLGSPVPAVGMFTAKSWAREGARVATDHSQFAIVVEMEAVKKRRFVVVQGRGVYACTAGLLANAAVRLASDGPRTTGVLSAAQAFDADWLTKAAGLELQVADDVPVGQ